MAQVFNGEKWVEKTPDPGVVDKDLAGLPSSWVTRDLADPSRIHEFDEAHTRLAMASDIAESEIGGAKLDPDKLISEVSEKNTGRPTRKGRRIGKIIDQLDIDAVRMRVLYARIVSAMKHKAAGETIDLSVKHVWFPRDEISHYCMREGNAPADSERPEWLKGKSLELDVFCWPERIIDMLKDKGVLMPTEGDWRTMFGGIKAVQ